MRFLLPRLALAPLLALAVAACQDDDPVGGGNAPATIAPAVQWTGGEVTLTWEGLRSGDPELLLDGVALDWTRVDGVTAIVSLPNYRPAGVETLTARFENGDETELGEVRLAGDAGSTPVPIVEGCASYPWPRSAPVGFLGCDAAGDLVLARPNGSVETFPGLAGAPWTRGFGVALDDEDVVILQGGAPGEAVAWSLAGGGTLVGPMGVEATTGPVIDLGANRYLVLGDPESLFIGGLGDTVVIPTSEPTRVAFAPDGSWATVMAWELGAGLPVIQLNGAGAVLFIQGIHRARSTAFTASGDAAYVTGAGGPGGALLEGLYEIQRSPVSGFHVVRWLDMQEQSPPIDLAFDESRGRLYAFYTSSDGLYLGVVDRAAWRLVATPGGASSATCAWCYNTYGSVLSDDGTDLHVTWGWFSRRFDLVP